MGKTKRFSLAFGKKDHKAPAVSLDWRLESPPIVFRPHDDQDNGGLLSGYMVVDVKEDYVELEDFNATLKIHITHNRPYHKNCRECQNQYIELETWQFLSTPTILHRGEHLFPFSTLLEGSLPASMRGALMAIEYEFKAEAIATRPHTSSAADSSSSSPPPCSRIDFEQTLEVKRILPGPDHAYESSTTFPSTNIHSTISCPAILDPTELNTASLTLTQLKTLNERTRSLDIWKVRKVTWKLEESTKTFAPACSKHQVDDRHGEPQGGREVERKETRVIGEKTLLKGWTADYDNEQGIMQMEIEYGVNQRRSNGRLKYACDSRPAEGPDIRHSLIIEVNVSAEYATLDNPRKVAPKGTDRTIRIRLDVILTDQPGNGVAWEMEMPPIYQDVPPSPPVYVAQGYTTCAGVQVDESCRIATVAQRTLMT